MSLRDYFESTEGTGVLGTADADGKVDLALYGRPHVVDEQTVAFIMGDRLSHANLSANPRAAYLFVEPGPGYKGKRLYLTKTAEETDPEKIEATRRENRKGHDYGDKLKFLITFRIEQVRPLTGD
ncbi:MAG: pyridoxamine 5'-phosphate oxidase family protein [Sedimentisphaerales bacterium]|nr:pyridoxamine 5'-phosphate oxidase family protein [Sedimentisphaerales bacterium]